MNADARLSQLLSSARVRLVLQAFAVVLPIWIGASALLWRALDPTRALALIVAAALVLLVAIAASARRLDARWLVQRIDAQYAEFDDSAELLLPPRETWSRLARLQQTRLQQRLLDHRTIDLRAPWRLRPLAFAWAFGLALLAAAWLLPQMRAASHTAAATRASTPAPTATETVLTALSMQIAPPVYTGLPVRTQSEAKASFPEGSTLSWTLSVEPPPRAARLSFHDGTQLALQPGKDGWHALRAIEKSTLYRIEIDAELPLIDTTLQRLDALADQPPQVRAIAPEKSLTIAMPGQRQWGLIFEATDDYGLGRAQLEIRHARGSGENISVEAQTLVLEGIGDNRVRRYARTLDLSALGFAQGDDLIVRLAVDDRRTPRVQTARSPTQILRWPEAPSQEAAGVEGLVEKVLPAYFRSQRQIIIDSEALLEERPKLKVDEFAGRADGIGVDQRILRLRYGQFLGEEDSLQEAEEHAGEDGAIAEVAGSDESLLEQYGHTHDEAEAATLLDPETRALLKSALGEMWQAEMQLRLGDPKRALPYEYRALGFIKQVQQASRIYLARVGLELPPVDETRRLSGDRAGLRDRVDPVRKATPADVEALALWQALEAGDAAGMKQAVGDFERWLRAHEAQLTSALDLYAGIDELRRDPACAPCRERLRHALWPLLPETAAATALRPLPDAAGQRYLDTLRSAEAP